jgi:Phospholipid methyltransferase
VERRRIWTVTKSADKALAVFRMTTSFKPISAKVWNAFMSFLHLFGTMPKDEARRIATNVSKLPPLLRQKWCAAAVSALNSLCNVRAQRILVRLSRVRAPQVSFALHAPSSQDQPPWQIIASAYEWNITLTWLRCGQPIKGKKRHILVDTLGLLLHAIVHSAGIQDRDGGIFLLATLFGQFPFLEKLFADSAYQGPIFGNALTLWSSVITRKEGHKIVDTGPYALVRHPIYTGLIIGLLATAVAEGRITGLIGGALVILGIWLKARTEERFLTAELDQEAYASYCRRVPMLVPFFVSRS